MKIYILLAIPFMAFASTVNLNEILQKLKYEHPMAKSIQAYEYAYSAENRVKSASKPLQLSTQATSAKPNLGKSQYEYSVKVQQKILNPSVKRSIIKSTAYQNDAEILKLKHDFLILENNIRLLYHINCLDKRIIKQYKTSYLAFKNLYTKKEKAYKYGEISKKELIQLQIELDRLQSEYKHYESEEKTSRDNLQSNILLPYFEGKMLSCKDTYAVTDELLLNNTQESLQERSLNKKIKSVESDFSRYNALFDSFTLSASYDDEIGTKRYIVGLSVPLNFTTSLNRENRAVALHKKSAFEYEKEGLRLKRASKIKLLKKQLLQNSQDIRLVTSMLKRYEDELMPLIKRGYHLGENSAIEYLLSQREMWKYKKDLIQHYKNYYKTLFQLYSVLEIKDSL